MNIKLVASDLDGTIIDKNNNIPESNLDAIKQLHNKNINFAICTGKSYSVSQKVCEQFNASFGIFGNGTQIIDLQTGKELLRNTLNYKDLLFVCTLAKRFNYHIHLYTENEIITESLEYMDLRNFVLKSQNSNNSLNFKIVNNILKYIENSTVSVFSMIVSTDKDELTQFQKLLSINENIDFAYINKRGKYRDVIIDKDYEYINISPKHINKDEALSFLSDYLKISKKDILAIGDNVNDYEMIKNSGIGIAINSSYEPLKEVASYVTNATVSEGGFAEAISKFINFPIK